MIKIWQLQEAKNKFSKVVEEAVQSGPQVITKHGVETAVVISYEMYQQIYKKKEPLSRFLRESPLAKYDVDLTRDNSPLRDDTVS